MNVKMEKVEKNTVQLEIELDDAQVNSGMHKAYLKLSKQVNIPGFRKGKAPRNIVETFLGKGALMEEAINYAVPTAYYQAVKDNNLLPVEEPKMELVQFEEDKPIIVKVTVDVKPEVVLGQYKGVEVTPKSTKVTDEDVEKQIENLQKRHAKLTTLEEGEVLKGDTVSMDFSGSVDGELFEGGTATDYSLEIGSGQFIPGFEDQMAGMVIGVEKDINVTFPEDYHAEELKGKSAVFKVTVRNLKRKELAEIDDEFAKDVSEFASLDELKADIKNRLEETEERLSKEDLRSQAVNKAMENIDVEIPKAMVESRINVLLDNFEFRLKQQGLELEKYMQYTNSTEKDLRDQYRAEAEAAVKSDLMLEEIAKAEGIEVSEEEFTAELEKIAGYYNQTAEQIKKALEQNNTLSEISLSILMNKTMDFLVDNCKKTA